MTTNTLGRDPQHSVSDLRRFIMGDDIFYAGCAVGISLVTGLLRDMDSAIASVRFAGVCVQSWDNHTTVSTTNELDVWTEGEFDFIIASTTQALAVGSPVWVSDNQTVTLTPGTALAYVGIVVRLISATKVRVALRDYSDFLAAGASAAGAVTQASSASTGVTLDTSRGAITTVAQNIAAAGEVQFTVTCAACGAASVPKVAIASGSTGGTTIGAVSAVVAGSFQITLTNLHASVAETGTLVINYEI